jgi:hypothetical protein
MSESSSASPEEAAEAAAVAAGLEGQEKVGLSLPGGCQIRYMDYTGLSPQVGVLTAK